MASQPSWGQKLLGGVGKKIDQIGKSPIGAAIRAVSPVPIITNYDRNLSEQAQRIGGYIANPIPKTYASEIKGASTSRVTPSMTQDQQQFQTWADAQRNSTGGGTYNTGGSGQITGQSGGQAADGGGGFDYLGALRGAFNQSRSALEGMIPTYDSDFGNFKSLVESGIGQARETFNEQNAADEKLYGQNLKSLLQSDKEVGQRRYGTYSALGSLDSSSYLDDTIKAEQNLLDRQGELSSEKDRTFNERQREFANYEKEALSKIETFSNEITRAKQALRQAIADVNLDEASSIENYIGQLEAQMAQVNSNREALAMNLAQLQAQGTDVVGNLSRLNMGDFSKTFGQGLSNRLQSMTSRYSLPTSRNVGAGYINPRTGAAYTDEEKRLLGLSA